MKKQKVRQSSLDEFMDRKEKKEALLMRFDFYHTSQYSYQSLDMPEDWDTVKRELDALSRKYLDEPLND